MRGRTTAITSGARWFVEPMDSVRVEMGPGEISFGEDQNTRQVDRRRGTCPAWLDKKSVLMQVQFEMMPTVAAACRFW